MTVLSDQSSIVQSYPLVIGFNHQRIKHQCLSGIYIKPDIPDKPVNAFDATIANFVSLRKKSRLCCEVKPYQASYTSYL